MSSEPVADPFALRERLLLPAQNRALRTVKRHLVEAQNRALEDLRLTDGWEPDASIVSEEVIEACGSITVGPSVDVTVTGSGVVLRAPTLVISDLSTTTDAVLTLDSALPETCPLPGPAVQTRELLRNVER